MTTISKSTDIDIELSDVIDFIDDAKHYEITDIIKHCKYFIEDNLEEFIDVDDFGIITKTLNDQFKLQAIKEIWEDLNVEEVETFVENFKTILKNRRK
jgi:hypothetical protein